MQIELSFTADEIRTLTAALRAYQHANTAAVPSLDLLETSPQARELHRELVLRDGKINALMCKLPLVRG
jgi:hypothetical protein